MKSIIILLVCMASCSFLSEAQSISQRVIASSGAFLSNANGSLSSTIGESVYVTLQGGGNLLTQGFQQPVDLTINIKAYLQGYYVGNGIMADVLFNQSVYPNPTLLTDSITIELHDAYSPYNMLFQTKKVIPQNGIVNIRGLGNAGKAYYIVIKHRNAIETWSAMPVMMLGNTSYDFSTSALQAYGGNQKEMEAGVWAIYAGEIFQDGVIDNSDFSEWEIEANAFATGYTASDLNGDGIVDNSDFSIWESNANDFVSIIKP
jgi:hypothetical protein